MHPAALLPQLVGQLHKLLTLLCLLGPFACRRDEAAGAATHVSSLSLEPESIAMQGLQGGPAVLHALAGILPQLDTPEASTNMDSTGDNQALVAGGAAAAPLLPASVPMPRAAIRCVYVCVGAHAQAVEEVGSRLVIIP